MKKVSSAVNKILRKAEKEMCKEGDYLRLRFVKNKDTGVWFHTVEYQPKGSGIVYGDSYPFSRASKMNEGHMDFWIDLAKMFIKRIKEGIGAILQEEAA